uniref:Uncharacterized protein n=1 Tax=Coccidioides posadasii RMSCC 3488 TaxID=454284 RepID=A0A0J6FNW9_COCPO|nr:hypothetical protein CPAG_06960 [Coccidioides posadasii RMSCC 3488]
MARGSGLFPVALAVGFGILNGYIVFQPAYADREAKKFQQSHQGSTYGVKEAALSTNTEMSSLTSQSTSDSASTSTESPKTSSLENTSSWWSRGKTNEDSSTTS